MTDMANQKNSLEVQDDALLQEIHLLKMKIKTFETNLNHLQDENEILLKEKEDVIKKWKDDQTAFTMKISKLKEEVFKSNENYEKLKDEMLEKEKEIVIKNENNVNDVSLCKDNDETFRNLLNNYEVEIEQLNIQKRELRENSTENKAKQLQLVAENTCLKHELEEVKRLLESKTQQLNELIVTYEELKEEKLLLSSELAAMKSAPADDNARGNSLFGEVEDRRRAMSSKLKILYEKYLRLKKDYMRKNSDYDRLKADLSVLQTRLNSYEEERPKAENRLIVAQNNHIKHLIARVAELERRPESPKFVTVDEKNFTWVLSFVEEARKEKGKLLDELNRYSLNQFQVEQAMLSKTDEMLQLKEEIMRLKADNLKLQIINETKENPDSTDSTMQGNENSGTSNKENIPNADSQRHKRVHFND